MSPSLLKNLGLDAIQFKHDAHTAFETYEAEMTCTVVWETVVTLKIGPA